MAGSISFGSGRVTIHRYASLMPNVLGAVETKRSTIVVLDCDSDMTIPAGALMITPGFV